MQTQTQYQNMTAEIHTHQHVYVVISETGEVVAFPPFTGSLNDSSLNQLVDMVNNNNDSSTLVPMTNFTVGGNGNDAADDGSNSEDTSGIIGGNGVFNCDQISNGQTTNFVNVAYPEFDSSDTDETCSFLLMVF